MDSRTREILSVLQHPIRLEIHEMLRAAERPLPADRIAASIAHNHRGVRSHLRALAEAGLAHGYATDLWVATQQPVEVPDLSSLELTDPDRLLVVAFWRMITERRGARISGWARVGGDPGWRSWIGTAIGQEGVLTASPAQLGELESTLLDALRRFRAERQPAPTESSVYLEITAAPLAAIRSAGDRRRPT